MIKRLDLGNGFTRIFSDKGYLLLNVQTKEELSYVLEKNDGLHYTYEEIIKEV